MILDIFSKNVNYGLQQIRYLTRVLQSAKTLQRPLQPRAILSNSLAARETLFSQKYREHNTSADNSATVQPLEDFLDVKIDSQDGVTHVEGILVPTGRENLVVDLGHSNGCSLCRLNLRNLSYTDVMILSQWIKKDGSLATYEESKLCTKQYMKVVGLIKKAQRCNLIARPADYFVPGPWHELNTYLEPDRKRDQPMKYVKKEYWK